MAVRQMARAAAVVGMLAVLAVQVSAIATSLGQSSCGNLNSGNGLQLGNCGILTITASNKGNLQVTVSKDDVTSATDQLYLLVWNTQQSTTNAWASVNAFNIGNYFTYQQPSADRTATSPATSGFDTYMPGSTTGSTPTNIAMGASTLQTACLGQWVINIDASSFASGSGNDFKVGVYAVIVPAAPAPVYLKLSSSVTTAGGDATDFFTTHMLPPSYQSNQLTTVYIQDAFSQAPYAAQSFTFFVKPTANDAVSTSAGWSVSIPNANYDATVVSAVENGYLKFTFNNVRPTSTNLNVVVTTPSLVASTNNFPNGYNVVNNGPLFGFSVAMGYVQYYPDITNTPQVINLDATTTQAWVQVRPDFLWWSMTMSQTVTDVTTSTTVANSPVNLVQASGGYGLPAAGLNNPSELPNMWYNADFYDYDLNVGSPVVTQYLAPNNGAYTPQILFRLTPSTSCSGKVVTVQVQATVKVLGGTCRSYVDCTQKDNPNDAQSKLSANSDSSRFVHCAVGTDPNSAGYGMVTPYARCVECVPGGNTCDQGQYCYADNGVCSFTGDARGSYICDPFSASQAGYCVAKSKSVLGAPCRSSSDQVFSTGIDWVVTAGNNMILTQQNPDANTVSGNQDEVDGFGFCGEARFFNGSFTNYAGSNVALGVSARTILWNGACVNGVCMECNPANVNPSGVGAGRQCVNGQLLNPEYVDFTPRTYTKNTVAGTLLGGLFMIVLLQCCFCADVIRAYRIRAASK